MEEDPVRKAKKGRKRRRWALWPFLGPLNICYKKYQAWNGDEIFTYYPLKLGLFHKPTIVRIPPPKKKAQDLGIKPSCSWKPVKFPGSKTWNSNVFSWSQLLKVRNGKGPRTKGAGRCRSWIRRLWKLGTRCLGWCKSRASRISCLAPIGKEGKFNQNPWSTGMIIYLYRFIINIKNFM